MAILVQPCLVWAGAFRKGDPSLESVDGVMKLEGEWEEEDTPFNVET